MITWRHARGEPSGRSSVWLQSSIALRFTFESPEPEELDPISSTI